MTSQLAIDLVSPLPPVRSGISDYSADLLPILGERCDLRLIELASQPLAESLRARWQPVAAARVGLDGRLPLYQMGNNEYHREIMDLALDRPGVVTLHDVVLHHLLVEMTLAEGRLAPYRERLQADHGWPGELAATARQWGELGQAAMFSLPAHRTLLRRQRGVMVHSRWAAERINEEDPDIEVRQIPMGIPLPAEADREDGRSFRRRLGLDQDTPLIGSMGFQTPIKRTEQVIAALGRPGMEDAHLLVAGEVSPVLDFEAAAAASGASQRLHVVGFLDFADFEQAIAACDLCVNLRYPTAGETSASLLRVLAVGRPAIVSDYAHSAELPDDVVVKVPLGDDEVDELASRVGSLLGDRPRLVEMGHRARRYIADRHDPTRSVAALVTACRELSILEPPGDRAPRPAAPTTLIWHEMEGDLEVAGAEESWREGEARRLRVRLTNRGPARWLPASAGTGGVFIDLQWRRDGQTEVLDRQRIELPFELAVGECRDLELRTRRPLGGSRLVVESHVRRGATTGGTGGPRWELSL